MRLHHTKHHTTYVTNLNNALQAQVVAVKTNDIVGQLYSQRVINFHAGGHINHSLFWANLTPSSSSSSNEASAPKLTAAISERWGSPETFKEKFNTILLGIQGSGWGWLVQDAGSGALEIVTTRDQDIVPKGKKPIFGVDFWEHAYYLQYLNDKASYAKGIWNVINWQESERRYLASVEDVFGALDVLKAAI